jgi:CRISPR/Cas system CSM-associated protein Csm2 small subunit
MVNQKGNDNNNNSNNKAQDKCALCGKPLAKTQAREGDGIEENFNIIDEIIDSSHYLFDTKDCATIFKKFGGVYGSNFYEDICEIS